MYLLKCHSRILNVNSDISEELVIAMATIHDGAKKEPIMAALEE